MFSELGPDVIRLAIGPILIQGLTLGLGLGVVFGTILGLATWHGTFGFAMGCYIFVVIMLLGIPSAIRRLRGAMAMAPLSRSIEAYLGESPVTIFRSITHTGNLDPNIVEVNRSADGTRQFSWTPSDITLNQTPGPHLHLYTLDPTTELITASYCVLVPKK